MEQASYYMQRTSDSMTWEEVDLYTWNNWKIAVDKQNKPRYTGNRVRVDKKGISLYAENLSPRDFAVIMRYCNVRGGECPESRPGGFVQSPEYIPFMRGNKITLHEFNGSDFYCRPKVPSK